MIFDCNTYCQLLDAGENAGSAPFAAGRAGALLVCAVSRGACAVLPGGTPVPGGGALCAQGEIQLLPEPGCELFYALLSGTAAVALGRALPAPRALPAAAAFGVAALVIRLCEGRGKRAAGAESALCYELVCTLADAFDNLCQLPLLAAGAIGEMREHYAELYGVEEVAETLGVSKSHLIRVFTKAVGTSPGKYLTAVRIDAAKRFLAAHAWPLDVVASLCGFSGANYFCRVFRRETGLSPAAFRAANAFAAPPEGNEADEWYL